MNARRLVGGLAISLVSSLVTFHASAEPSGAHPRILLDPKTRAAITERAGDPNSATSRAVRQCTKVAGSREREASNVYMGFGWAAHATNCALAWHATRDPAHAKTALHFFSALLRSP